MIGILLSLLFISLSLFLFVVSLKQDSKGMFWFVDIVKNELTQKANQSIQFELPKKVLNLQQQMIKNKQRADADNPSHNVQNDKENIETFNLGQVEEFDSHQFIQKIAQPIKYDKDAEKYIVITGASGGMGEDITLHAAKDSNFSIIMAVRNIKKAEAVRDRIIEQTGNKKIEIMQLDLSSLDSVLHFCDQLLERKIQLVRLMNNAGTMVPDRTITKDGYEATVETNFIAPVLLTLKLLPLMPPESRIVNMLSLTYKWTTLDNKLFTEGMKGPYYRLPVYCNTKQAFLYVTMQLSEELKARKIHVAGADPGIVSTGIISMGKWFDPIADLIARPLMYTPEQGASAAVKLLFDKEPGDGILLAVHGERKIGPDYRENSLKDCVFDTTIFLLQHYF